jgi:glutathione S-transferase
METQLEKSTSGFLVGDKLTIADVSCWGWVASHSAFFPLSSGHVEHRTNNIAEWSGIDIEEFPLLKKWLYTLLERPGFEAGRNVPGKHTAFEHNKLSEEELDAKAAASRGWIQAGMKDDAAKK